MTTARNRIRKALAATLAACIPWITTGARAQDYPVKSIRVIVPYAAGGGVDLLARLVGQELGERL
ncbi:MAG: hypothetical protein ACXWBL_07130, partial [Usitatibacter sp.]